jgi:RNA polymerase sigma-70 factor (ECF subfamily)
VSDVPLAGSLHQRGQTRIRAKGRTKPASIVELFKARPRIINWRLSFFGGEEDRMKLSQIPGDEDLLRMMVAGDEEAFTTLYRRRQGAIYRFALHMSGSAEVAEDVTQEVFMTLIGDGGRYDPGRGSLASYLYGIARNHVLRRHGADRYYVQLLDGQGDEPANTTPVAREDPFAELARGEVIEAVRRGVLALPPHYREVIVLCDLHEMNYADAACVMDCAIGTVRSRLHRARKVLAEKLRTAADNETEPASETGAPARCLA